MDNSNKSVEPDTIGRVMALEQKTRGLSGRVSALEIRFSPGETSPVEAAAYDATEFVPGEPRRDASVESRIAALEAALGENGRTSGPRKVSAFDVTGLVIGISLLAVGALLATDSIDLLRNPLLASTAGAIILACAAWRLVSR